MWKTYENLGIAFQEMEASCICPSTNFEQIGILKVNKDFTKQHVGSLSIKILKKGSSRTKLGIRRRFLNFSNRVHHHVAAWSVFVVGRYLYALHLSKIL